MHISWSVFLVHFIILCLTISRIFFIILGHLDVVQFFMNSDEFTEVRNKREETPLHLSSKGGYKDVVKFIFEKVTLKEPRDKNGAVPLHMASFYGQLNVVKYLISVVDHKDPKNRFGYTPLHFAGILLIFSEILYVNIY